MASTKNLLSTIIRDEKDMLYSYTRELDPFEITNNGCNDKTMSLTCIAIYLQLYTEGVITKECKISCPITIHKLHILVHCVLSIPSSLPALHKQELVQEQIVELNIRKSRVSGVVATAL